tara:strand:- start:140 stop:637 length:498 start_codon:yes stop_codon:yes gene_type:complete
MLLTSIVMGAKIRTMWMTPFYLFTGTFIIYIFKSQVNLNKLKNFASIFIVLFLFSPFAYAFVSITQTDKRTDYPGKEIARLVENRWNENFSNEIVAVVGDEWFGGNLSYHLNSRPIWFNSIDKNLDQINITGGVIYTGNPKVLKKVCPGVFGTIRPIGICMIGVK